MGDLSKLEKDISLLKLESKVNEILLLGISSSISKLSYSLKSKSKRRNKASYYTQNKKNRERILKKYNNKCSYCNSSLDLCLDHILPISKGGEDEEENIQVLCRSCNSVKGNKTMEEFLFIRNSRNKSKKTINLL